MLKEPALIQLRERMNRHIQRQQQKQPRLLRRAAAKEEQHQAAQHHHHCSDPFRRTINPKAVLFLIIGHLKMVDAEKANNVQDLRRCKSDTEIPCRGYPKQAGYDQ